MVHAADASCNSRILAQLLGEEGDLHAAHIRAEQQALRADYARAERARNLVPLAEARAKGRPATPHTPVEPLHPGRMVFPDFDIADAEPFIDWNFFFPAWGLKGRYPEILDHPERGEEARKLFADAQELLRRIRDERLLTLQGAVGIFPARAEGDDIVVRDVRGVLGGDGDLVGGDVHLRGIEHFDKARQRGGYLQVHHHVFLLGPLADERIVVAHLLVAVDEVGRRAVKRSDAESVRQGVALHGLRRGLLSPSPGTAARHKHPRQRQGKPYGTQPEQRQGGTHKPGKSGVQYSNVPYSPVMVRRLAGASSTRPTTRASMPNSRAMAITASASPGAT